MIPTKDGLVVAGDSRHTLMGVSCDNDSKIYIPQRPPGTVATVTGTANFLAVKQPFGDDPCKDIAEGIPLLSIPPLVLTYLEGQNAPVGELDLNELARQCVERLTRLFVGDPNLAAQYRGRQIFTVAIASYDAETKTSAVRSFEVSLSADGIISVKDGLAANYGAEDKPDFCAFGQGGYLREQVLRGPGRKFVGPDYQTLSDRPSIADVEAELASDMGANLIEATSKTADLVPIPTGVGGPLDVYLISSHRVPERLR